MGVGGGRKRGWVYLGNELAVPGLITDDDDNLFHTYCMPGTMVDDLYKLS